MTKSPAILFYTSDFLSGTLTMTDEEVGKYIRLLCLQHQQYRISEKHMKKICGSCDDEVFSKFVKDERGYYNERLEIEILKRQNYSQSRANNRKHKEPDKKDMKNISKTYVKEKSIVKKSIDDIIFERQDKLKSEIVEYQTNNPLKYPKTLYRSFFNYWSEPYKKPTQTKAIKQDKEDTWNLSGRLATFYKRGNDVYDTDLENEKRDKSSYTTVITKEDAKAALKIINNLHNQE